MLGGSGGCVAARNSDDRPRKIASSRATNRARPPPARVPYIILEHFVFVPESQRVSGCTHGACTLRAGRVPPLAEGYAYSLTRGSFSYPGGTSDAISDCGAAVILPHRVDLDREDGGYIQRARERGRAGWREIGNERNKRPLGGEGQAGGRGREKEFLPADPLRPAEIDETGLPDKGPPGGVESSDGDTTRSESLHDDRSSSVTERSTQRMAHPPNSIRPGFWIV
ncbi:hypothetical protein KM043_006676 [Ampulex compressa]|nr:hypothetical protein KM043_006676 [Ampulex compressa]